MKKQPIIKILVACHKASESIREDDIYMPIQVGKALHPELDLGFQCDNTGDNISDKNDSFCELTALYWAWKNLKDVDYIGLAHYRRYFDFHSPYFRPYSVIAENEFKLLRNDNKSLLRRVGNNQFILARPYKFRESLYENFSSCHKEEDLLTTLNVIDELYPKESTKIRDILMNTHELCPFNMFVMSWTDFDKYCSWLFSILFEAEKRIDTSNYNSYQKRLFGFMSERLLIVYCKLYQKKRCYRPLIFIDDAQPSNYSKNWVAEGIKKFLLRIVGHNK